MKRRLRALRAAAAALVLGALVPQAFAQDHDMHDMSGMSSMPGLIWDSMSRESSGTSWQPASTPMPYPMIHIMSGGWMWMLHGNAYLTYVQAGTGGNERDGSKTISTNMAMIMGRHDLGPGVLGVRAMLSLEPATVGRSGYPLLLQTGETSDGHTPLIDRQHAHDLFMELSASYSLPVNDTDQAFVYLGLPGEPAIEPATFMHRFSGMDNPEAPITHHWLDSTHITYGVATVGYSWHDTLKLELSSFTGREPDQTRWDIETPKMDSQSIRLTYNPTDDWSFQVSYAHLNSPEQLEPDVDQNRITASATYNLPFGPQHENNWQTTFAWAVISTTPAMNSTRSFSNPPSCSITRTRSSGDSRTCRRTSSSNRPIRARATSSP